MSCLADLPSGMKYLVRLERQQRDRLQRLVSAGKAHARQLTHARILLLADLNASALNDQQIHQVLDTSLRTIGRVRQRFVQEGLDSALNHQHPQNLKPHTLNPEAEAHLIALACTHEKGQARMSLRLLADKMVELGYVDKVSHETVRKTLKKTTSNLI